MANCPHCGEPLDESQEKSHICQIPPEDPSRSAPPQAEEPPKKPRKMLPLFAIPLTIVVVVAALVVILFSIRDPITEVSETPMFSEGLLPVATMLEDYTGKVVLKWGYVNTSGKYAFRPRYEAVGAFAGNGLAAARLHGLWGYTNRQGELVIEEKYEAAGTFSGSEKLACVKLDGAWGYINEKGEMVINPQFDSAYDFGKNGLALVEIGGKYGFINTRGVYVIPPQYDGAESFDHNGLAAVLAFGKWGLIDKTGSYAVNPQFDSIEPFTENGLALIEKDGSYGFIDKYGTYVISPKYEYAESFSACGLALVVSQGKYSYIDKSGNIAIENDFVHARSFGDNDLAAVSMMVKPKAENGKASAEVDRENAEAEAIELWGYINKNGDFVIDPAYTWAADFSRAFAGIKTIEGTYAYIRTDGSVFMSFDENCVSVSIFYADDYAFITEKNEEGTLVHRLVSRRGTISEECWLYIYPFAPIPESES